MCAIVDKGVACVCLYHRAIKAKEIARAADNYDPLPLRGACVYGIFYRVGVFEPKLCMGENRLDRCC